MKTKTYIPALVAVTTLTVSSIHAATTWTGTTDSDFGTATNWNNSLPGAVGTNENATIGNGDTVSLTGDQTGLNNYRLIVTGNSTLNVSGSFDSTHFRIDAGSTVNLNSGSSYDMTQTSGPNNGSAGNGPSIAGTLNISGGTHDFEERLAGSGTGIIRVIGNDATINFHQIGGYFGDFDFVFASDGVSTITGQGGFPWFGVNTSDITVDGSAYNLTYDATFDLLNSSDAAGAFTASQSIAGFAHYYDVTVEQVTEGGRRIERLVIMAPEPSSTALLGLGLSSLLLRRRR
jgi:hypothetical protein